MGKAIGIGTAQKNGTRTTRIGRIDTDQTQTGESSMPYEKLLLADLTDQVLEGFYHVYNTLGFGFLEAVYRNALRIYLRRRGMEVFQQYPVSVFFDGEKVGKYFADLFINQSLIIEIKAVEAICKAHETQLINYLRTTPAEVGLLLNFGPTAAFRRKVFTNDRKNGLKT
jgi:GxxExxY protein